MKYQHFKSSNEADDLDQLCKLSVHSMSRSLARRSRVTSMCNPTFNPAQVQGQRISIPSWSNISLSAIMVALEYSIKLR
jgi:hypothetical protein